MQIGLDANESITTMDGITDPWKLACGIPQGEVLSPLRFVALMDILGIWLMRRCHGENPEHKEIGYSLDSNPSLTIFSRLFCDDILLITDDKDDIDAKMTFMQMFR